LAVIVLNLLSCIPGRACLVPSMPNPDAKMQEIAPGLFLGGSRAAYDLDLLTANNITHILQVTDEFKTKHRNIKYKVIPAQDRLDYDLSQHFEDCIAFIDKVLSKKERAILVHCLAGISRSPSVVIAYMIKKYNLTYEEALALVVQKRPFVNPNIAFTLQLENFAQMVRR